MNSEKASHEIEITSHWDKVGHLPILQQYEAGTGDYAKERDFLVIKISTLNRLPLNLVIDVRRKPDNSFFFSLSPAL